MKLSAGTKSGLFARLLGAYVPKRVKRMILVASAFAKVRDSNPTNDALICKLNKAMKLSANDNALRAPIQLKNLIWKGSSKEICSVNLLKPHLTQQQIEDAVNGFTSHAPQWLIEDGKEQFQKDLKELLSKRDLVLA